MSKFNEIRRESKIQKLVKTQELLASSQCTICKASIQQSTIFVYIVIFDGTLCLLIFANKKIVVKSHYVRVSESYNLVEHCYFLKFSK
jgi:hypothetical protein